MTKYQPGERVAFRQHPRELTAPVVGAEVVRLGPTKHSHKVRVRWLDGDFEGLEEWITDVRLICRLSELEAVLHDEARRKGALESPFNRYNDFEFKVVQACLVLPAGADVWIGNHGDEAGLLCFTDFERDFSKVPMTRDELLTQPEAFVDRTGAYWAPFVAAQRLAERCCVVHAAAILQDIAAEEKALRDASVYGYYTSPRFPEINYPVKPDVIAERLRDEEPLWAEVRRRCGETAQHRFDEHAALKAEVARLRELIERLARGFDREGRQYEARALLRELNRTQEGPRRSRRAKTL